MISSPLPTATSGGRRYLLALAFVSLTAPCLGQPRAPESMPGLEDQTRPVEPAPLARPAWMGVRAAPGVHIQEVIAGGPAERAGLRKGDLITSVDFRSTMEEPGLMGVLREKGPGDVLVLDVMRDGEDLRVKLVLGEFPLDLLAQREKDLADEARLAAARVPRPAPPDLPPVPDAPYPSAVMRHAGQEERAFLGVRLQELTPGLAVFLGLPEASHGVLVEHVHEESPAETIGLRAGDVLLAVDGQDLLEMNQLGRQLRDKVPGDGVQLQWWSRKRQVRSAEARLVGRKKEIWVVSPPERAGQRLREDVQASLEARLRMLEEQRRRVELEQDSVRRKLEEMEQDLKPRP